MGRGPDEERRQSRRLISLPRAHVLARDPADVRLGSADVQAPGNSHRAGFTHASVVICTLEKRPDAERKPEHRFRIKAGEAPVA